MDPLLEDPIEQSERKMNRATTVIVVLIVLGVLGGGALVLVRTMMKSFLYS